MDNSAAFTAPAGLSIITTTFAEGPARNRALSIYTATGATGFSLGLVFGGLLTELGWRWTFLLPAPVALAIVIAARRLVPADQQARRAGNWLIVGKWPRIQVFPDTPASLGRINRSQALGERDCGAGPPEGECSGALEQRFDRSAQLRPELDLTSDRALRDLRGQSGIEDEFVG